MRQVRAWKWWSREEITSWPPDSKRCRACELIKHLDDFHKTARGLHERANDCKACRQKVTKANWKNAPSGARYTRMYFRAKSRAKKLGREFTITLRDLHGLLWPNECPILGIPMTSASLDRIDPSQGYVPGNLQIISSRANTLKNNGTLAEFEKIVAWMKSNDSGNGPL